jgi:LysR family transcriptional regulator, transcriptional activator of the cysJI operon
MEEHFVLFKEVAETKNITLAAKRLHMSQPSITLQIQSLENEYGVLFFDRTNKGVTLTKAGEIFYEHILKVLDILEIAKEQISDLSKEKKKIIHVGATLTIAEYILPSILALLSNSQTDVEFKVTISNTELISQQILEKKLHIGLIEGQFYQDKDLNIESFWNDELVVVIPYFHPWVSKKNVTLAEFLHERLVLREEGAESRKVMKSALSAKGFDIDKLNILMELESTHVIKQVVAAGLGITFISSLTVNKESERHIFRTLKIQDVPGYQALNILTNNHITQTKEEKVLINTLRDRELIKEILSKDYYELERHVRPLHLLTSK